MLFRQLLRYYVWEEEEGLHNARFFAMAKKLVLYLFYFRSYVLGK